MRRQQRLLAVVIGAVAGLTLACKNPVSFDLNKPAPTQTTATVTICSQIEGLFGPCR
jgi:hypothetical protein